MQGEQWMAGLQALGNQLATYFGPPEVSSLLHNTGFEFGERYRGRLTPEECVAAWQLPLKFATEGFHSKTLGGRPGFLADALAGLLEGLHPDHCPIEVEREAEQVEFHWAPEADRKHHALDFHLPARGPLTPFQFAQVTDLSADAVLFVDRDLRFRAWNHGAAEMFGYSAEEAVGQYYDLLVPEDLRQAGELEKISGETRRRGTLRNYRTRRRTKDGRELTVSLTRTAIRNRDGILIGYGVILHDISEEEALKAQLEAARTLAQVGELASQVAHEIRNPLAGIHGALQVLRRRNALGDDEATVLDDVGQEISRLDRLVTDLLRFGRPSPANAVKTDLGELLEQWRARMYREAHDKEYEIAISIEGRFEVEIDPVLFEPVLRNLFQNALEAASERLALILSVPPTMPSHPIELHIRDDGPGIPQDLRQKVLQPFFTTKATGSGLGLAICQRHLHALGGDLKLADSESGTHWIIRLRPAARA